MGLGAPKRRDKLSHDPNNTAWSRSTQNFGHRILSSQGWQPGEYLGAKDATHSEHYSAANASHVRVLLREDNLGLGAKIGGNKAETFGLSLFSGVLGRLNGKSDEQVQKQQDALRDAELRTYHAGTYGLMNFVSGGLLVGDKIEKFGQKLAGSKEVSTAAEDVKQRKRKRRKVKDEESGAFRSEKKKERRRPSEQEKFEEGNVEQLATVADEATVRSRPKGTKKEKHGASESTSTEAVQVMRNEKDIKKRRREAASETDRFPAVSADETARLKQEKRACKEERRKRKEARRIKRAVKESATSKEARGVVHSSQPVSGGRHAVRHRYIQQKRMSGMDAQAMKEIFMIKAAA